MSGKELERALGVTYKTAWRMGQQIRVLMAKADGFETMQGHVEIAETYVGGYRPHGGPGKGENKTIVLGIVERGGLSSDEAPIYDLLKSAGYDQKADNHSKKQWRKFNYRRDEYHHTNSVESFWRLFKNSIRSTHIHVSAKYMDRYLKEFTFRSNHRQMSNAMFDLLIASV